MNYCITYDKLRNIILNNLKLMKNSTIDLHLSFTFCCSMYNGINIHFPYQKEFIEKLIISNKKNVISFKPYVTKNSSFLSM